MFLKKVLTFFRNPEISLHNCFSTVRIRQANTFKNLRCHFTPVTLRRHTGGTGGDPDDRNVVSLSRPRVSLLSPGSPLMVTSANLGELCPIYNNFSNRRRAMHEFTHAIIPLDIFMPYTKWLQQKHFRIQIWMNIWNSLCNLPHLEEI